MHSPKKEFALQEGPEIFTPKNLFELSTPGVAVANAAGDLALVQAIKHSVANNKTSLSFYIVPLNPDVPPYQVPLDKGGEVFWIADRTIALAVSGDDHLEIYALKVTYDDKGNLKVDGDSERKLIGGIPTKTATNFRYRPLSNHLVFSDRVYKDGDLTSVKEQDEAYESRGHSAMIYDSVYPRLFDSWLEPKRSQLFSVRLTQDVDGDWSLGDEFKAPLKGTDHYTPVPPFHSGDDFDVSATDIVYTTKDPLLQDLSHTRQNIYIVDIEGKSKPRELTTGKQGATSCPAFNTAGTKVAWLELDKDVHEADRAKIVIFDLQKDVRFTVTQKWDRSPNSVIFSKEDDYLIFTAPDHARIKVFTLPVPPTPENSSTDPDLDPEFTTPFALTHECAASGIQALPSDRILFSLSSFRSPNDVYIAQNKRKLGSDGTYNLDHITRITRLTEKEFEGKQLHQADEIWFKGANDVDVHGWVIKPRGWKAGETAKWPVILHVHGGPQYAWTDSWWPMCDSYTFAEQGYFVVLLNPTGSTSFGQEFTDAVTGDWGGKPFVDLVAGWNHALSTYPEIDRDRAVATGISWGGYAMTWIQGHPEYGFNFKAIVTISGPIDTTYLGFDAGQLSFWYWEFGGRPWEPNTVYEKFNPRNFVTKWSTPMLVLHGSKDYVCPETEALATFNTLQQLGIPSRLVIFPDEAHFFVGPGNCIKRFYEILRWFDLYVGDHSG